ncbi:hypothetical protein M422DRAFT_265724 [Sphaerobolus stellatus SS14]|uniref:F-box domain-containing protein n=1 Tax=Sphaerobolus stellatus (strain SS14) TaxID=990650 RepID=A0A0C9TQK8_SPHS4|nr:hypothetical protein M422DRAFT_265724 [Sphaerobolus stellatus SS14]
MSFVALPTEIIDLICTQTPRKRDLLALALTCRQLSRIAIGNHLHGYLFESSVKDEDFWDWIQQRPPVCNRARDLVLLSPFTAVTTPSISLRINDNDNKDDSKDKDSIKRRTGINCKGSDGGDKHSKGAGDEDDGDEDKCACFFSAFSRLSKIEFLRILPRALPPISDDNSEDTLLERLLSVIPFHTPFLRSMIIWSETYTPTTPRVYFPFGTTSITHVSIDMVVMEPRPFYPLQYINLFLIVSCPFLSKLEVRVHQGTLGILRDLFFEGAWTRLTHLTVFERGAILLSEDDREEEDMAVELNSFLVQHHTLTHVFLSITTTFIALGIPWTPAGTHLSAFALHLDNVDPSRSILIPSSEPSQIRDIFFTYTQAAHEAQVLKTFPALKTLSCHMTRTLLHNFLRSIPHSVVSLDISIADPMNWGKNRDSFAEFLLYLNDMIHLKHLESLSGFFSACYAYADCEILQALIDYVPKLRRITSLTHHKTTEWFEIVEHNRLVLRAASPIEGMGSRIDLGGFYGPILSSNNNFRCVGSLC